MGITFGDHLIDSGYYDITPEQEREIEAREECERRGINPDELCADGGVEAWMVVAKEAAEPPHVMLDAVMSWMIERGWIDAGNEYRAADLVAALNDNAGPGAFSAELAQIKGVETQIAELLRRVDAQNQSLRHWREECGKLHSQIGKMKDHAAAERARAEHLLAHKDRQAAASRKYWVRAAKGALAGDPRELRNRVDLAEADPVDLVLSKAADDEAGRTHPQPPVGAA